MNKRNVWRLLAFAGLALGALFLLWLALVLFPFPSVHGNSFSVQAFPVWLANLFTGNFGTSLLTHQSVASAIQSHLLPTFLLGSLAYLLYLAISIPLRSFVLRHPQHLVSRLQGYLIYAGFVPTFRLVVGLILFFSINHQLLPFIGFNDVRESGTAFGTPAYWDYFHMHTAEALVDLLKHLVLPLGVLTLLLFGTGYLTGQVEDAAANEGTPPPAHPLLAALHAELANSGMIWAWLVSNLVVVESLFSFPGIGSLFVTAITASDYALVIGVLLTFAKILFIILVGTRLLRLVLPVEDKPEMETAPEAVRSTPAVGWSVLPNGMKISLGILAVLVALAIFAPLITPGMTADTINLDLGFVQSPPTLNHFPDYIFGATGPEDLHHSVLAEVTFGLRTTLVLSLGAAILATTIGVSLAQIRSKTLRDDLTDAFFLLPIVPLAMVLVLALNGTNNDLLRIGLGMSLAGWPIAARFARQGNVGSYLEGGDAQGKWLLSVSVVCSMLGIFAILESALGLEGIGVHFPPTPSLGNVLANSQNDIITGNWWWPTFPSLFSGLIGINAVVVGQGIRTLLRKRRVQRLAPQPSQAVTALSSTAGN